MKVRCPTCGHEALYAPENPYRPFCSERCRLIDLGAWSNDEYVIEGEPGSADLLSPEDLQSASEERARLDAKALRADASPKRRTTRR
ncbi:MAG: DNA gyrase inhibitor YacG [Sutterella sp.]|nr:DNA gyrase inhibitor YacG [Sutterella sp.]